MHAGKYATLNALAAISLLVGVASADTINTVTPAGESPFVVTRHDAIATAAVQMFNFPVAPRFATGATEGPDDTGISPGVIISTRPGVMGAIVSASALSRYQFGTLSEQDFLRLNVEVSAAYHPSFFGGDNPGAMASATVASVIEFRLPSDRTEWLYTLRIDDTIFFDGAVGGVLENVTTSQVIGQFNEAGMIPIPELLDGSAGDLMRLTAWMAASGSTPPGSSRFYDAELSIAFVVPEPATLTFLGAGLLLALQPRRRVAG